MPEFALGLEINQKLIQKGIKILQSLGTTINKPVTHNEEIQFLENCPKNLINPKIQKKIEKIYKDRFIWKYEMNLP